MPTATKYKAEVEDKACWLEKDFAQKMALRHFGLDRAALVELVGVKTRGKYKGALRGEIRWLKITRGGWVKTGMYDWDAMRGRGYVAKRGVCFYWQIVNGSGDVVAGRKQDPFHVDRAGRLEWQQVLIYEQRSKKEIAEDERREREAQERRANESALAWYENFIHSVIVAIDGTDWDFSYVHDKLLEHTDADKYALYIRAFYLEFPDEYK